VNVFDPGLMPSTGLARDYSPRIQRVYARIAPAIERFMPGAARPQDSGRDLARLVTDPELDGVTATYFEGRRPTRSSAASYDRGGRADLWRDSAALTGALRVSPGGSGSW
jgi:hypothetical protein